MDDNTKQKLTNQDKVTQDIKGNTTKYNGAIDCFKGILTLQMILAHCFQFYSILESEKSWHFFTDYINLTTFSGFVFAFGYVGYTAYIQHESKTGIKKIIKNILRLVTAFYISSFAYVIFIEGMFFREDKILDIILIKRLAGWSEFLIAFAGVLLITIPIRKILNSNLKYLIILGCISLISCSLPTKEIPAIFGVFIGGYGNAYYPVVPYYLYFIIGIYFVRKQVKFNPFVLVTAMIGTGYTVYSYIFISKGWPSRFPLSLAWLTGAMLFLYGYYLLSYVLEKKKYFNWLAVIGKYSLYYLLFSNLIIFSLKRSIFYKLSVTYSLGLFAVILFIIWYTLGLIRGRRTITAK